TSAQGPQYKGDALEVAWGRVSHRQVRRPEERARPAERDRTRRLQPGRVAAALRRSTKLRRITGGADDGRPVRVLLAAMQLSVGGAERLLVSAARNHDHGKFHIELVYALAGRDALAADLRASGVGVACLGWTRPWDPRWILRFRRLARHGNFDVVHFHSPFLAGVLAPVLRTFPAASRPAVVVTEHSLWSNLRPRTRALNAVSVPLSDARVAVSEQVKLSMPVWAQRHTEVLIH